MAGKQSHPPNHVSKNLDQIIDQEIDNALICPNDFLKIEGNNYHLDAHGLPCEQRVEVDVLEGNPLHYALTATNEVSVLYLEHVWHTIRVVTTMERQRIEARQNNFPFVITPERFSELLQLPASTANGQTSLIHTSMRMFYVQNINPTIENVPSDLL